MLKTVPSYHYMQLQGKLINQTGESLVRPNSGRIFFFPKNLAPSVTRYHGQLSSCTITEKTNDPILKKLSIVISQNAVRLTSSVQHSWQSKIFRWIKSSFKFINWIPWFKSSAVLQSIPDFGVSTAILNTELWAFARPC